MLEFDDLVAGARMRFGTAGEEVNPERRTDWRERLWNRVEKRAAKSVREGETSVKAITSSEREQYKVVRKALGELRSNADLRSECDALAAKIDKCLNAGEDGEKAAKSIGAAVASKAAELADAGDIAGAIQACRMLPHVPAVNFSGK